MTAPTYGDVINLGLTKILAASKEQSFASSKAEIEALDDRLYMMTGKLENVPVPPDRLAELVKEAAPIPPGAVTSFVMFRRNAICENTASVMEEFISTHADSDGDLFEEFYTWLAGDKADLDSPGASYRAMHLADVYRTTSVPGTVNPEKLTSFMERPIPRRKQ